MLNKTTFFFVWAVLLFAVSPLLVSAQPGGERERIKILVDSVIDEISEADKRISKDQNNRLLYEDRGKLYVKLYRIRYLTQYYSPFYEDKTYDTKISTITTKAIADFDKAIRKDFSTELLKLRGEMYAIRWFGYVSSIYVDNEANKQWRKEIEDKYGKEWSDVVENISSLDRTSKQKAELVVLEKLLDNRDFGLARKDFENALKICTNQDLAKEINENIGRLLMIRAGKTSSVKLNRNLLTRPNKFDYSILDDLNQGLGYLQSCDLDKVHESGDLIRRTFYENFVSQSAHWYKLPTLRAAFVLKAEIVKSLGDETTALESLNEAEKTIDRAADSFACDLYPFRGRIYLNQNKLDAAFEDANQSYRNSEPNRLCNNAYELRGDVQFEKGNFQAAIKDYTNQLKYINEIVIDTSIIYKKRGFAYLKLNNSENAITDFTNALNAYSINIPLIDYYKRQVELLKLRTSVYRQIVDNKRVLEGEKAVKDATERLLEVSRNRHIFGKVKLPDDLKIEPNSTFAEIIYDSGAEKYGTPIVDGKGYFDFLSLKNEPFYIYLYFETYKNGVPVRYYGKSKKLDRGKGIFGPIIINLLRAKNNNTSNFETNQYLMITKAVHISN
jgi:tetratricopeptide (TPR) repeat protein